MATPLTLPLEIFFEILNMEIVVNNNNNNNFHTNCNFHTMDIVWIYYGFSDAIANLYVEFHYFFQCNLGF
jgi:hypothetical protein